MAANDRLVLTVDVAKEALIRGFRESDKAVGDFVASAEEKLDALQKSFSGVRMDDMKRAIRDVRADFTKNFTEIQQLAAKAVQTGASGGQLNIGSTEARAAAEAARQQAIATRAIADAAERSTAGVTGLTVAQRSYVQAAQAAAAAAELEARNLAQQAGQVERLEIELRQAGVAQALHTNAQRAATAVTGAQRAGMQNLSYQIGDISTQFALGAKPMQIFAGQANQVLIAVQQITGASKGFIGFLTGPWGVAILGAVTVLGYLATSHDDGAKAKDKHKTAADALKDALDRMSGAAAENNHQTRQGIIDDINAANAILQREVATRKLIIAEQEAARQKLKEKETLAQAAEAGGDPVAAAAIGDAANLRARITDLDRQIGEQNAKIVAAAKPIVVRGGELISRDVAGRDPRVGVQQRYDDTVDAAQRAFEKSGDGAKYRAALTQAAATRDASLKVLDGKKTSGAAARRAEAARQREIGEDIRFSEEERKLRGQMLDALGDTTASEEGKAALAKEQIDIDAAALKHKYDLQQSAGKLDAAEAAHLKALTDQVASARKAGIDMAARARLIDQTLTADTHSLDADIAILRIRQDMAKTMAERKEIGLRILAKEQELERKILQAIIDDPTSTEAQAAQARTDLSRAIDRQRAETGAANDNPRDPLDAYFKSMPKTAEEVNEAIKSIEADGLKSLEDGIVDVITGTRKMGDVFKDIANQIIADLIRIAVQKFIVNTIASAIGFADGGEVPTFADGGMFSGPGGPRSDNLLAMVSPGEFIVNAESTRKYLPLIRAINDNRVPKFAGGGAVTALRSPTMPRLGGMASGPRGASVTQHFDLRGAFVDKDAYAEMQRIADERIRSAAPEIVQASSAATQRDIRRRRLP